MGQTIEDRVIGQMLDEPLLLQPGVVERFQRDGFVRLAAVLPGEVLTQLEPGITKSVIELNSNTAPMAERSTYQRAFLQVTHLWRHNADARRLVHSRRLAKLAADLLGVESVRLLHEQALYKEPSGGFTPWHADQYYWPLDSDRAVTVWIPLQDTPMEMGPLEFAPGSQLLDLGRDLEISDESEAAVVAELTSSGIGIDSQPFSLGDVSYHRGWTFHRAGPNVTEVPRRVLTIVYVDAESRFTVPTNYGQQRMIESLPGAEPGGRLPDHLPLLYP